MQGRHIKGTVYKINKKYAVYACTKQTTNGIRGLESRGDKESEEERRTESFDRP